MLLKCEVVMLTPEKATELLENRLPNRSISQSTVACYASDIISGRWHDNCVPITLNSSGRLADGQHRCAAVIKTGCSIPAVFHWVDDKSAKAFDLNRVKSTRDSLIMDGIDTVAFKNHGIIGAMVLMLQLRNTSSRNRKPSKFEQIEHMKAHKESIEFTHDLFPTNIAKISRASVFAAFMSAYESGYDKGKMTRFAEVLKTGFMSEKSEKSIIRLRDFLMRCQSSSASASRDIYYTVMNVLWNYERGNELSKIYVSSNPKYQNICDSEVNHEHL